MNAAPNALAGEKEKKLKENLKKIKHSLVVLSGKGGVGKSTIAANFAVSFALAGKKVGLLDIDFHGPSIPKIMGIENTPVELTSENQIIPLTFGDNLKVMSLGLLLNNPDDAVIWRGPMKIEAINQLLRDVEWGELDYLFVDCPPGTGDEPLSIVQTLENPDGAIIVTTPQDVSVSDVRRSVKFCEKLNLPVAGVIENMSGFVCPHCSEQVDIFKNGGSQKMAEEMNVPFLAKIPIEPDIVQASDSGEPYVYHYGKTETAKIFQTAVETLIEKIEAPKE